VTYALHLYIAEKPVVDFLLIMIEFFRYLLRLSHYKRKSVEVGVSQEGGSLGAQISDGRGRRPPTTVRVRKLECSIKIIICSALFGLATEHACDRHTDGQTDNITTAIPR